MRSQEDGWPAASSVPGPTLLHPPWLLGQTRGKQSGPGAGAASASAFSRLCSLFCRPGSVITSPRISVVLTSISPDRNSSSCMSFELVLLPRLWESSNYCAPLWGPLCLWLSRWKGAGQHAGVVENTYPEWPASRAWVLESDFPQDESFKSGEAHFCEMPACFQIGPGARVR